MKTGEGTDRRQVRLGRLSQFLEEASRRRVWRTALTYAAIVFILLQLGEIVFPAFGAPDWALRLLVTAGFLGFPLVLALAWAFDITAGGIQRTGLGTELHLPSQYTGTTLPRLALLAVTMVTVGGVGWWVVHDTLEAQGAVPTGPQNAQTSGASLAATSLDGPLVQVRSLAVLPLDDFSEGEGGEYFTAGLHEELVSQLSQVTAARVLSRTSVVQYDATGKTMPLIADDLGVEGVVEGSVFRDGNRVRITVQLIHGPTDQHLWANSYDGTLEDAIGLQRTVASAIAKEIQAELFPTGEGGIPGTRVAANPTVQEEYMRGRFDQFKATPEALESAINHFEAAVEEDSTFAPAYAGLAGARLLQRVQSGTLSHTDLLDDGGIVEPLELAFKLDETSPEAQAVFLTLKESLGDMVDMDLPDQMIIMGDSAALLEAEISLAATEFGRHLQRIVVKEGFKGEANRGATLSRKLASANRTQATHDFETAEELIRSVIKEAPESQEAWDALEQLKTVQEDFEGVARVRRERLALDPRVGQEAGSVESLEERMAESGNEGFWSWRAEDLESRKARGEDISSVFIARAYLGLEEMEKAFLELEAAIGETDRNLVSLWTDPAWDTVRTDPRFRDILSKARRGSRPGGSPPVHPTRPSR